MRQVAPLAASSASKRRWTSGSSASYSSWFPPSSMLTSLTIRRGPMPNFRPPSEPERIAM